MSFIAWLREVRSWCDSAHIDHNIDWKPYFWEGYSSKGAFLAYKEKINNQIREDVLF